MSSLFRSFSNKRENAIKEALLNTLNENIGEIEYDATEKKGTTTLEVCDTSSALCTTLEAIFLHGLKDSLSWQALSMIAGGAEDDMSRRPEPSFWSPLLVFLHKQVIEQMQTQPQLTSEIGQCRAWVRLSLNESVVSSYFHNMRRNSSALGSYYKKYALLRDRDALEMAAKAMEGLEATGIAFDLPINSSLLNQWPDYALQLSGLWTPTLKSQPVNSGVDVASALAVTTPALPTPQPLRTNEAFDESISNSPFRKMAGGSDLSSREHVDMILAKVDAMQMIAEEERDKPLPAGDEPAMVAAIGSGAVPAAGGNSLSSLMQHSWSVEADRHDDESAEGAAHSSGVQRTHSITDSVRSSIGDYNTVLRNYNRRRDIGWMELWEKALSDSGMMGALSQAPVDGAADDFSSHAGDDDDDHDPDNDNAQNRSRANSEFVLITNSDIDSKQFNIVELQSLFEQLCNLAHEIGLDAQGFLCHSCQHPLSIGFKTFQVCAYSGNYFCDNCMAPEPSLIPAKIIYNWDFGRYALSKRAAAFLAEFGHMPLIDLMVLNPAIYNASDTMAELQSLRIRLNFIRAYLQTCGSCHDRTGDELKLQFYGREYLYEHIHQYAITDLALIRRGTLQQQLQKAYKLGEEHILKCALCSLKGFICEICNGRRVLYPFHIDTTYRCETCGAVFHPQCLNEQQPCPKCERIRRRVEPPTEI